MIFTPLHSGGEINRLCKEYWNVRRKKKTSAGIMYGIFWLKHTTTRNFLIDIDKNEGYSTLHPKT